MRFLLYLSLSSVPTVKGKGLAESAEKKTLLSLRHIDLETKELALDTKVYCLKSILDKYKDDSLKSQCKSMIKKWQEEHQRGTKMNLYVHNVLNGLDRKGGLEVEDLKLKQKKDPKFKVG
jgi:hypothetical protein